MPLQNAGSYLPIQYSDVVHPINHKEDCVLTVTPDPAREGKKPFKEAEKTMEDLQVYTLVLVNSNCEWLYADNQLMCFVA